MEPLKLYDFLYAKYLHLYPCYMFHNSRNILDFSFSLQTVYILESFTQPSRNLLTFTTSQRKPFLNANLFFFFLLLCSSRYACYFRLFTFLAFQIEIAECILPWRQNWIDLFSSISISRHCFPFKALGNNAPNKARHE